MSDKNISVLSLPIVQTLSAQLTWSHYLLLLRLESQKAREWYGVKI